MKKAFCSLLLLLVFVISASCACAEAFVQYTGQVHPELPVLTLTVTDTGERTQQPAGNNLLQVVIEAQDGSLSQKLTWESIENPAFERMVPLARFMDLNFDGYNDLVLLVAQGARNEFCAFSMWDVEAKRFRPVYQDCEWLREEARFSDEIKQVELCNPELFPEKGMLLSDVQDGYRFSRQIFYMWDGSYHLTPKYICDVYDAGEGLIGESMTQFMTRVTFLWDEHYPEDWYHGQDGVAGERRKAAREMALGGPDRKRMQVANVEWVHLRKQDNKASPSLARINAGEQVTVLVDECGSESGWVRVLYDLGEHHSITLDEYETGRFTLTGYIWHSFLEPLG